MLWTEKNNSASGRFKIQYKNFLMWVVDFFSFNGAWYSIKLFLIYSLWGRREYKQGNRGPGWRVVNKFGTGTLESRSLVSWAKLCSFCHTILSLVKSMERAGNEQPQGCRRGSQGISLEGLCEQQSCPGRSLLSRSNTGLWDFFSVGFSPELLYGFLQSPLSPGIFGF